MLMSVHVDVLGVSISLNRMTKTDECIYTKVVRRMEKSVHQQTYSKPYTNGYRCDGWNV